MLTGKLILRGWKGVETEIGLRPLTFLVGPNGSGKSGILESLALVSHLARRGTLREDLRPWLRGWPDGVFTRSGGKVAPEASFELEWGRSSYRIVFQKPRRPEIREESLRVGQKTYVRTRESGVRSFTGEGAGPGLETDNAYESALALIARSPKRRKRAQAMIDLITRIEIYALDADFLRGTVQDPRPLPYARKGTGLVAGLIDAKRDRRVWDAVIAALRAIQPDFDEIVVQEKPRGAIVRYVDGRETELDEESDGFVRAAGMFLVRYRPESPAILGFDEPENGYHLSRLVDVVARLAPAKGSYGPDLVLLATHSPSLVLKAVKTLKAQVAVVSLWRSGEGRVMVRPWAGEDLQTAEDFDAMVAEAFEGR